MKKLYYTVSQINGTRNHAIKVYMIQEDKLVRVYCTSIIISCQYKKKLIPQVESNIRDNYQLAILFELERIN